MRSSIKIDFVDRGTGKGIEPVIRVEIISSDDPRDTLVSHLFKSLHGQSYLQLSNSYHQPDPLQANYNQHTVLLFKPEVDTDETASIIKDTFMKWLGEEKYVLVAGSLDRRYSSGDKSFSEDELFKEFVSIKAVHST